MTIKTSSWMKNWISSLLRGYASVSEVAAFWLTAYPNGKYYFHLTTGAMR